MASFDVSDYCIDLKSGYFVIGWVVIGFSRSEGERDSIPGVCDCEADWDRAAVCIARNSCRSRFSSKEPIG